jgi:UDP-N-acetylmuramyl pentapeptide synthase
VIGAAEIIESLGSLLQERRATGNERFRRVVIDSRECARGDLFVALRGERTDGQRFAGDAVVRGARGLLVRERPAEVPADVALFVVPDTLAALQRLAAGRRERRRAKVIITGSVGKTTTKEITAAVLGARWPVL